MRIGAALGLIALSCATVPKAPAIIPRAPVATAKPAVVPPNNAFVHVDEAIARAIEEGKMPGCVVVVGRHDEILLRRAYGSKSVLPERTPMTVDTVFDLASLTKPLVSATSIMILRERGAVDLDAPAATYVPELSTLPPFTV